MDYPGSQHGGSVSLLELARHQRHGEAHAPHVMPQRGRALKSDALPLQRLSYVSSHFRMLVPASFARGSEFLDLAEALLPLLERHFGVCVSPVDLPLEVRFFETQAQYQEACRTDDLPDSMFSTSGGGYWTGTRASCFFKQPSDTFDRHLFIHELTHHVHYTACMGQQSLAPEWYIEGIAEVFAYHKWAPASKLLRAFEWDVVALEEDAVLVAEQAKRGEFSLCRMMSGKAGAAKASSWSTVYYLLHGLPDALRSHFRTIVEPALSRGTVTADTVLESLFGAQRDERAIDAAACAWIAALAPRTWKIVWINWDEYASDAGRRQWLLHSSAAKWWSLIVTQRPATHITASFSFTAPLSDASAAAIAVAYVSAQDFFVLHRPFKRDVLMLQHYQHDVWQTITVWPCTLNTLTARVTGGKLAVTSGPIVFTADFALPASHVCAPFGLMAFDGDVTFSDIAMDFVDLPPAHEHGVADPGDAELLRFLLHRSGQSREQVVAQYCQHHAAN